MLTCWEATGFVLRHWPRRDGIQPIPRPQEKYFRPQSWLQNNLFVGNKMFPALGFFFFLVLSLLLSRKGKCLSKRPNKHLRKPKPGSFSGRVERRVNERCTGPARAFGSVGGTATKAILSCLWHQFNPTLLQLHLLTKETWTSYFTLPSLSSPCVKCE